MFLFCLYSGLQNLSFCSAVTAPPLADLRSSRAVSSVLLYLFFPHGTVFGSIASHISPPILVLYSYIWYFYNHDFYSDGTNWNQGRHQSGEWRARWCLLKGRSNDRFAQMRCSHKQHIQLATMPGRCCAPGKKRWWRVKLYLYLFLDWGYSGMPPIHNS